MSPSYIPTFIIDSPLTLRVKTSFLLPTSSTGRANVSSGCSIASIGVPAVTLPRRGTFTTSSCSSKYSFGTNISIVLLEPSSLEI